MQVIRRVLLILVCLSLCLVPAPGQAEPVSGAIKSVVIDFNTLGDKTLVAARTGETIRVYKIVLFCNGANNITWKDSTPATLIPVMHFTANQGVIQDLNSADSWYETAISTALVLNLSANQQCSGRVHYTQGSN